MRWALSCTSCGVGQVPFESETLVGLLLMHAQEPPPPPSEIVPGQVPPNVEQVILNLMEKDPEVRPQTAVEVADLLERLLAGGAGTDVAGPAQTVANPGKLPRQKGDTVGMGGVGPSVPQEHPDPGRRGAAAQEGQGADLRARGGARDRGAR